MGRLNLQGAIKILSKKDVDFEKLITNQFSLEVLEQYADKLEGNWWRVSKYQSLTEDFMRKFEGKLNWDVISQYQILSEKFMAEFEDKVSWNKICQYQRLSEGFIKQFKDKMVWHTICEHQKLSEDFMIAFADKINWEKVSQFQKMSLSFMEEMWSKVDRKKISEYQNLTEQFVWKRHEKISEMALDKILKNVKLSESFLIHILQNMRGYTPQYAQICLKNIVVYQKLSQDFCVRYEKHLPLGDLIYNKLVSKEEREQILTSVGILSKLA
jgi:hypothetical protein